MGFWNTQTFEVRSRNGARFRLPFVWHSRTVSRWHHRKNIAQSTPGPSSQVRFKRFCLYLHSLEMLSRCRPMSKRCQEGWCRIRWSATSDKFVRVPMVYQQSHASTKLPEFYIYDSCLSDMSWREAKAVVAHIGQYRCAMSAMGGIKIGVTAVMVWMARQVPFPAQNFYSFHHEIETKAKFSRVFGRRTCHKKNNNDDDEVDHVITRAVMTLFTHATTVALTTSSVMAVSAISSPAMSSSQIAER